MVFLVVMFVYWWYINNLKKIILSSDSVSVPLTEEVKGVFSNDVEFGNASTTNQQEIQVISICDLQVYTACDYDGKHLFIH